MNHTKGPWSYRPDVVEKGFYIETVDMSHKNTFIGDVGGGLQSKKEIEGNAKLIATAPELLASAAENCKAFNKIIEILPDPDCTDYDAGDILMQIEGIAIRRLSATDNVIIKANE